MQIENGRQKSYNRKQMKISITLILFFFIQALNFAAEFSIEKAQKIDFFFKRIAQIRKKSIFLKRKTFTENELNSYFNLIYLKKYAPEVKIIKIQLENKNSVNGRMKVKLTGKKYDKVPSFLRDFEIEFKGKIECQNYRMRYLFEDIRINGTTFAPELLDEAFSSAQTNIRIKKSLFDWFNLLPGIKNVTVEYKKITIFY